MATIICKIADIIVEVPALGGVDSKCSKYIYEGIESPDIIIDEGKYHPEKYCNNFSFDDIAYMESARQFYTQLLHKDGFYLHASAVELDGKAYLFSGKSGVGKSTHTRLWKRIFGHKVTVFNDDKPALRFIDGKWYAYGTPWCGKDGINQNMKVPLAGICFLKQAPHNKIRRLSAVEAIPKITSQTIYKFKNTERLELLLGHLDKLLITVPVYELENKPENEAALLSYDTMRRGAEESNL